MNLIDNHLNNLQKALEYYESNIINNLKDTENEIKNEINKILADFSNERKFTSENSVYSELPPFRITSRTKEIRSLEEKFIRGAINLNSQIDDELYYTNFDDLIGLTIILDTNRFLKDFKEKLIDESLLKDFKILNTTEEKILKQFSARVPYYNLKYIYKNKYPVEIQIKSALVFEFANLEHRLIYKNRRLNKSIYLSREIMSSISNNIKAIDDVIIAIENSIDNSDLVEKEITEKEIVVELLSKKYKEKLDIFSSYNNFIYYFMKQTYQGFMILKDNKSYKFEEFINDNCMSGYNHEFILPINALLLLDNLNDPYNALKWFLVKEMYDSLKSQDIDRKLILDLIRNDGNNIDSIVEYIRNNEMIFKLFFSNINNESLKLYSHYLLIEEMLGTTLDDIEDQKIKSEIYMLMIGLYISNLANAGEQYNKFYQESYEWFLNHNININELLKDKDIYELLYFKLTLLEEE